MNELGPNRYLKYYNNNFNKRANKNQHENRVLNSQRSIFTNEMIYYFSNSKYKDGNEIDLLSFIVFGTLLIKHD